MKTVIAKFTNDNYANVYDVYQWDYGQVLRIEGLKLPNMVEIHFSLQETSGEAKTRIGVTKDGVTDVVIPDGFLENEGIGDNYKIFVWVYVADKESGSTEYKITIHIKARAKPEITHGGQDGEVFQEAVEAVRDAAKRAAESEKQAEGYAHGREDLPERAEDNAKYYCGKASEDAKKTAEDRKEVERLVESVSGIDEQVTKVEESSKNAQEAATQAGTSAEQAELHKQAAETASSAAQTAAQETEADRTSVEKTKETVENLSTQVQKNKESVDKTTQDFNLAAQQALADVNNAGQTQTERVQTAGATAVENIKIAQNTATQAVETAKAEAIKTVADKGKEVLEAIPNFDVKLDTKLDKNLGTEHAGKALVIGEDGNVVPGKVQTEGVGDAADAIVNTVSGTLLNIKDSAERKNKGFGMSGKTTQDGTPTPDAPVEIVNAGRLNSDTGKYEVDVKVTGKNIVNIPDISADTPGGTILCRIVDNAVVSAQEKAVASNDVWHICFYSKDGKKQYFNGTETHKAITATPKNPIVKLEYRNVYITSGAYKGIMVEYGTVATKYESYKEQTLTLTSDRQITKWDKLVEQDGQIGWLYASKKYVMTGNEIFEYRSGYDQDAYTNRFIAINDLSINRLNDKQLAYCKILKRVQYIYAQNKLEEGIDTNANQLHIKLSNDRIGVLSSDDTETRTTKITEYIKNTYTDGIEIMYMSNNSVFVPFPQSEQDAIRALTTYYPTTVVSNSEDTEMQLTYVADTKNYTDRKIEQAVSAQVQNLANLLSLMPDNVQAALIENDTNRILESEVNQ